MILSLVDPVLCDVIGPLPHPSRIVQLMFWLITPIVLVLGLLDVNETALVLRGDYKAYRRLCSGRCESRELECR